MAMSKSSEIAELEGRLNEALMALETSRADTRMAMTAAKKSQTDEQKLLEIQNKYFPNWFQVDFQDWSNDR